VNGVVTTNNNKVLASDIICLYDSDETFEINTRNKKETSKKKDIDLSVNTSKNEGNHTILIIGDSHVRGCASKLEDNLDETYNVIGIVKPGADIITLTNSIKDTILTLGKNDVMVFSGCAKIFMNWISATPGIGSL
jgi:hypothetical protein